MELSKGLTVGVFFLEWHIVRMSLVECNHMNLVEPKEIDCLWEGRLGGVWCECVNVILIKKKVYCFCICEKGCVGN